MSLSVIWRVLRTEGAAAVAARIRDRLAEARRRRSFLPAVTPPHGFSCSVLNLATAAPSPRLGGAQAQLLWRLEAEARLRPVALLYPEPATAGAGYRLELQMGGDRGIRRVLRLTAAVQPSEAPAHGPQSHLSASRSAAPGPLPVTALTDPELERAVAWAASICGATALQVEGLAGMPIESLLRLRQGGLRLILAIHDFAAFCPRPHLLEIPEPPDLPRFCHYSRDAARCARCLGRDVPGLEPGYQERRREQASRLLASAAAIVYPSSFLARTYDDLFAGAGRAAARVIAPAAPPPPAAGAIPPRQTGPPWQAGPIPPPLPPRHVAWVGAVQPHKGALVFEAALRRLAAAGRLPRLSAYGGGGAEILVRWRRLPGLRVRGYYRAGSLPRLLRRDRVDLALLLSVVPESYGLTLDECAAAGVPVVAFDLGAPAERIIARGSGLLLAAPAAADPETAGTALATLLVDLLEGRLATPPSSPPLPPATPAAAAEAWNALYQQLGLLTLGPRTL
jgi:glycosyltransferase involved in cell wall biosynthesis